MSDPVARLNAALEGRYAIERELGEGGMATVYLADDLKHERHGGTSMSGDGQPPQPNAIYRYTYAAPESSLKSCP